MDIIFYAGNYATKTMCVDNQPSARFFALMAMNDYVTARLLCLLSFFDIKKQTRISDIALVP